MSKAIPLHVVTPLNQSVQMTKSLSSITSLNNVQVLVKLDCVQPGGSFKIRGIGHLAQQAKLSGATKLCSSSGGNAGMATAYAAQANGMSATVVVPSTTPAFARDKIQALGAEVVVHGNVWDEADQHVKQMVKELGEDIACYVPPFEHPTIWEGHATMIDEIKEQMNGAIPSCIVVSVGGGGLLCGVLVGLQRNGWENVPVVAVETKGAESFHKGMEAGEPVRLEGGITSIAKSLGATIVSSTAVSMSTSHPGTVTSVVVTDAAAVQACCKFADDHRCMVEPACGAALAGAAYDQEGVASGVHAILCKGDDENEGQMDTKQVVVIACGGNIVSRQMMDEWQKL